MTNRLASLTAFTVLTLAGSAALAAPLELVCVGQGDKVSSEYKSGYVWDSKKKEYVPESRVENGSKGYSAGVTVRVSGDSGSIRLPKSMIPPIHSSGDGDGWYTLEDVIMGDNEIRASFKLNGLNHPKLRIDRSTGLLTMKGTGFDFTGRCDKIDAGEKRF